MILQELDDGTVLLRLAHLYEVPILAFYFIYLFLCRYVFMIQMRRSTCVLQAGEDVQNSVLAEVELKKIFTRKTVHGSKCMLI